MKSAYFIKLLIVGITLAIGTVGCVKKGVKGPTPIPKGQTGAGPGGAGPGGPGTGGTPESGVPPAQPVPNENNLKSVPSDPGALSSLDLIQNMVPDREHFRNETIYFEFDRSTLKPSETSKAGTVASYLRQNDSFKVQIEGHCDERGTEEYNRSLGERRALSVREQLVRLGIEGNRIFTLSWGEDKPADAGHDDAAWAKNRRAEFILLKPKPQ